MDLYEYVMQNDVCPLGKFGAWLLLGWGITMIVFLVSTPTQKTCKILGIINLMFAVLYAGVSLMANTALFIRCIPYFCVQLGVSVWLLNAEADTS